MGQLCKLREGISAGSGLEHSCNGQGPIHPGVLSHGRQGAATGEYSRERLTNRQIGNVELLTSKTCVFEALNIPHPPDTSGNGLKVQVAIGIAWRRAKEQIAIEIVSRLFCLATDKEGMPGYYRTLVRGDPVSAAPHPAKIVKPQIRKRLTKLGLTSASSS